MNFELILMGKTDEEWLKNGFNKYFERLGHYGKYSLTEIPSLKNSKNLPENVQKQKEGEQILIKLNAADHVILLDEKGKQYTSLEFSSFIQTLMNTGNKRIVFIIGGPFGFSEEVYKRANNKISLSKMTFSHQMVRLFFAEQLYRAMTILKGERYHHE